MKYRYVQNSFTSGELHPRLDGRTDLEEYARGVSTLENFITFRQGGVSRRMGSRYIADLSPVADTSYVGLVPFIFSKKESYNITIEARTVDPTTPGDTLRFKIYSSLGALVNITTTLDDPGAYATHKDITIAGNSSSSMTSLGTGLENLTTEINNFVYVQSADTLFITHNTGRMKPLVIARIALDKFYISNIEDYFWTTGPKKDSGKHITVGSGSGANIALSMRTTTGGGVHVPFFSADAINGHHGAYFIITNTTTDECFKINWDGIPEAFTGNFGPSVANQMASTAHGLNTGDVVRASGTLPAAPNPLVVDTDYYVMQRL